MAITGFIENIKDHQPNWNAASGPALVLGAGGASRAVLSALIEAGAPEIYLSNRTRARADQLKTDLGARIHVLDWSKASEILDGIDLMVNTYSGIFLRRGSRSIARFIECRAMVGLGPCALIQNLWARCALIMFLVQPKISSEWIGYSIDWPDIISRQHRCP